jgi:hypothetical protein
VRAAACWFFIALCRTFFTGGVLGNEWRSLAGLTRLYRGTTFFSTRNRTYPSELP